LADGEHVLTFVGGGKRETLHPSIQVGQYRNYLADGNIAFHEDGSDLSGLEAYAYLHNCLLETDDPLLDPGPTKTQEGHRVSPTDQKMSAERMIDPKITIQIIVLNAWPRPEY